MMNEEDDEIKMIVNELSPSLALFWPYRTIVWDRLVLLGLPIITNIPSNGTSEAISDISRGDYESSAMNCMEKIERPTGDAHFIFLTTCLIIKANSTNFITWPQRDQLGDVSEKFLPPYTIVSNLLCLSFIAVVDSTLIKNYQPLKHFAACTCRKKFCAVILQAISTKSLKFTSVSTGWPGSIHDARVFENSALGRKLPQILRGTGYHLLGDQAYPLSDYLMKSYPRTRLTKTRRRFNRILNSDRACIERAFAIFKNKWQRLKFLYMLRLDLIPSVIITSCCLHNFVIEIDGIDQRLLQGAEADENEEYFYEDNNNSSALGIIKKRHLFF
ncbi:Nuclease HARBI1-like protein [Daphnia magna]|uniref:Nuclease HARBI1-like protein n=1 Tax=Daphnia magna TaxID=35525 RepID=A0A162R6J1_9CRUS|nr:Nuclease HARBI1-like protein [Daphnia magna]